MCACLMSFPVLWNPEIGKRIIFIEKIIFKKDYLCARKLKLSIPTMIVYVLCIFQNNEYVKSNNYSSVIK